MANLYIGNKFVGLYHVGYQWNPDSAHWKNISWGAASSPDLCSWDVSSTPSITPASDGGSEGVFTGCLRATNSNGETDGVMTILYTSVSELPIHYTAPYVRGSERLHMATSRDNGKTLTPYPGNPVLPGPPPGVEAIGWRDPYVAEWHSMDRALGEEPGKCLYGLISGGVKDDTPAAFLYSIPRDALHSWNYLGLLCGEGTNYISSAWTGDYGVNWEVGNFLSLPDGSGRPHDYLIMSVEGCLPSPPATEPHSAQMWIHGLISVDEDNRPAMKYQYGGRLDHGRRYYAPNSFWDPTIQGHVTFGWVTEHDIPEEWHDRQGWSGMLSLPRVLRHEEVQFVCGTLGTPLEDITSLGKTQDGRGTYTVSTLASAPHPALEKLRGKVLPLPPPAKGTARTRFTKPRAHLELNLSVSLTSSVHQTGLSILHSPDATSRTTLIFSPQTETFTIDRSRSSTIPGVNTAPETALHTLFTFRDPSSGATSQEPLDLRVFYDVSVLEVFLNERTAVTTRVYPDVATCFGIEVFVEETGDEEGVVWRRNQGWEIVPRPVDGG
ncbi:putative beta-Fructufuranosidase [Cladophialophora chaetospira]|uniref:Beta-Fructufuranosidase n=1 Tax=Cladophialophora chaetospira TaxID=386627 RepID=A0AA38X8U1_9EURO|nr:putative beta-Fructufuranosidase [Cladophialophora chaetospira]